MKNIKFIKESATYTGECGDNFLFYLYEDILYIEGTGELTDDWDFYCENDSGDGIHKLFLLAGAKRITISDGCTAIGDSVFDVMREWNDYQSNFIQIEAPFEAISLKLPYGVTRIGERAFAGCDQLKILEIPETVTQIGEDAFLDVPHIVYHGPAQSDDNWGAKKRN